jgi:hypothetical protein
LPFDLFLFVVGLTNTSKSLKVGVVCLSDNEAIAVRDQLSTKRKIHDKVNLEVKFIGNLEGDLFDVIIVSTIVKDNVQLNNVNRNSLNIAHTSARYVSTADPQQLTHAIMNISYYKTMC